MYVTAKRLRAAARALIVFTILIGLIISMGAALPADVAADAQFRSDFMAAIKRIYDLITTLMLPVAVVGFSTTCVTCMIGDRRDMEKAMKRIVYLFIAMVCLYILPLVIQSAIDVFMPYTYTPA